jgi:hypothetical protein
MRKPSSTMHANFYVQYRKICKISGPRIFYRKPLNLLIKIAHK